MKTIVKKTIVLETKRYDFENEFAYIEIWQNNQLKDCYFAEKEFLFPDGTIKSGGKKYFFCNSPDDVEKKIKPLNYANFQWFDHLYFLDESGEIFNIIRN